MKNLFKKIKLEQMTNAERVHMTSNLKSFMAANPVVNPVPTATPSPFYTNFFFNHKILATAFAFILIVSATSGTSQIAQNSLPGDLLYSIKINFNEKLETFTTFSDEDRVLVEAKHLDTRIMEAVALETSQKLEGTIKTEVENRFKQNLQETVARIDALESKGDKEITKKVKSEIEASLSNNIVIIDKILENKKSNEEDTILTMKAAPESTPTMTVAIEAASTINEPTAGIQAESITEALISTTTEIDTKLDTEDTNEYENDIDTPTLTSILERISKERLD